MFSKFKHFVSRMEKLATFIDVPSLAGRWDLHAKSMISILRNFVSKYIIGNVSEYFQQELSIALKVLFSDYLYDRNHLRFYVILLMI